MKRKLLTSCAVSSLLGSILPPGLLFVYASARAQQSPGFTPAPPSANTRSALAPQAKDRKDSNTGKAPVQAQKPGSKALPENGELNLDVNRLQAAFEAQSSLKQQLAEAMQEGKTLRERLDTLNKEFNLGHAEPGSLLRQEKTRRITETQAKLADKVLVILEVKQRIEQNASTIQSLLTSLKKPGIPIPPSSPAVQGRTLLFTPADAATLIKRNLLLTPEDRKRVQTLPKSDGSTNKP